MGGLLRADAQEKLVHSELESAKVKAATDAALEDKVLELSEAKEHAKQVGANLCCDHAVTVL